MLPSDPEDWLVMIDKETGKVVDKKTARIRRRTARAQQMDESNDRTRERREKLETKKKLAIEAGQSQVVDDNDQFAFGPAAEFIEPTYTGDEALDSEKFRADRAAFLLRRLEYVLGEDLRPAWQRGELSLADLEAKYQKTTTVEGPGALAAETKGKGKDRATSTGEGRPTNYDGISFGRRIPADIDSSDDDNQHASKPVARNKSAPTAAQSRFSPLVSTETPMSVNPVTSTRWLSTGR